MRDHQLTRINHMAFREGNYEANNQGAREGQESAAKHEAPQTVELGSRDTSKYRVGQRFDKGEYHGKVIGVHSERSTITVELDDQEDASEQAAKHEDPKTEWLQSTDATKYKAGQRYDDDREKGKHGTIVSIDYMHDRIQVALDGEEAEAREAG